MEHCVIKNGFCEKINRGTTEGYCRIVCKGQSEKYREMSDADRRAKNLKPVTDDGSTVSVLIPYSQFDWQYVNRTIDNVYETAEGRIEVLEECDSEEKGHRYVTNRLAQAATGKFLFRLDAHCKLTNGWDVRLKQTCREKTIAVPLLDSLDEFSWESKGKETGLVILTPNMRNAYPVIWKNAQERQLEEETMSIIGCAYMIRRRDYWDWNGCDESLGKWGASGLEWSLKTWLTGGQVLIRTDTVCSHLFRPEGHTPFKVDKDIFDSAYIRLGKLYRAGLAPGQTRKLEWLVEKFHKYLTVYPEQSRPIIEPTKTSVHS